MGDAGVSDQTLADAAVGRRPAGGAETLRAEDSPHQWVTALSLGI